MLCLVNISFLVPFVRQEKNIINSILFGHLLDSCIFSWYSVCASGVYKVQAYDGNVKGYMPVQPGVGVHIEVTDPDEKVVLSRVSLINIPVHHISREL